MSALGRPVFEVQGPLDDAPHEKCGQTFRRLADGLEVSCVLPAGHACAHAWEASGLDDEGDEELVRRRDDAFGRGERLRDELGEVPGRPATGVKRDTGRTPTRMDEDASSSRRPATPHPGRADATTVKACAARRHVNAPRLGTSARVVAIAQALVPDPSPTSVRAVATSPADLGGAGLTVRGRGPHGGDRSLCVCEIVAIF